MPAATKPRGRVPAPRRGTKFYDAEAGRWRYRPADGGRVVDLHSPEGEAAHRRENPGEYDAGRALRRAGVRARADAGELSRTARRAGGHAGRALKAGGAPPLSSGAGVGWGELALYMAGSVLSLALLRNALEGRGPAGVELSFGLLGKGIRKLVDPADPLFVQGPAAAPSSAAAAPTGGAAGAAAGGLARFPTSPAGSIPGAVLPVPASAVTSIGGVHPTGNLPGYPAVDVMAPAGTPVLAPEAGKIVKLSGRDPALGPVSAHGAFGWSVYVRGVSGATYFLTHLGTRSAYLGETVAAGEPLGTVALWPSSIGTPAHVHVGVNR